MTRQLELPFEGRGEAPSVGRSVETPKTPGGMEGSGASGLMERVVSRPNMLAAYKRVRENKGSPGIDGVTVEQLPRWLKENWARVREELLAGSYQPTSVRRQMVPKRGGGERELGIPTAPDRLIQQALLQVLQPIFDPTFSDHSYGFRPGRRAHDAVRRAQGYVQEGRRWVVDVDLERFLGTSPHYTPFHGLSSKSPGWLTNSLMRNPLRLPRLMCSASSWPRFTRCNTDWRERPRTRMASTIGT